MSETYLDLQKLRKQLDKLLNNPNVYDVVLFGSFAKGEATKESDIDLCIFTKNEKIGVPSLKLPFKTDITILPMQKVLLQMDKSFIRRLLREGISLTTQDKFAKRIGLEPYVLVRISLKNLEKKDKSKFSMALRKRSSILEEIQTEIIGRGILKVPEGHVEKLRKFLEYWKADYKETNMWL